MRSLRNDAGYIVFDFYTLPYLVKMAIMQSQAVLEPGSSWLNALHPRIRRRADYSV